MQTQEVALRTVAGSGALAAFLRVVKESDFDFDLDTLFEFGLMRLLDGLEVYLGDT